MNSAKDILELYWDGYLPVDPVEIAKKMGVKVIGNCNLGHSGHFFFDENGMPTISYNTNEHIKRQKFTVAHELGHYVNGDKEAPRDTTFSFDKYNHDIKEVNANRFAAELLMPDNVVMHLINFKFVHSLDKLAKYFGVSTGAMHYRLVNLGLINNVY